MKSILKATVVLGSSTVVSMATGLVAMKVYAKLLGPEGLGYLGLLQSAISLGVLGFGLALSVGQVRFSARAMNEGKTALADAYRRAAAWLLVISGAVMLAFAYLAREPLAELLLGDDGRDGPLLLSALAVLFNFGATHQVSVLNARHDVGAIARNDIAYALLGPLAIIALVVWMGERGLAPGVALAALVSWGIAAWYRRRRVGPIERRESAPIVEPAKEMLRFCGSVIVSRAVGSSVVHALPVIVLHMLNEAAVGLFKASSVVSTRYMALVTKALGQDFYPRVSARADEPEALSAMLAEQHRLLLLLVTPMLLAMMCVSRWVLLILYDDEFLGALDLLQWLLVADLVRTTSWSMGYVVLARSSRAYLATEAVGGASMLACVLVGMHFFGLDGLGAGQLIAVGCYYLGVQLYLRRDIALRWPARERALFWLSLTTLIGAKSLSYLAIPWLQEGVSAILALGFTAWGGREIWASVRASRADPE